MLRSDRIVPNVVGALCAKSERIHAKDYDPITRAKDCFLVLASTGRTHNTTRMPQLRAERPRATLTNTYHLPSSPLRFVPAPRGHSLRTATHDPITRTKDYFLVLASIGRTHHTTHMPRRRVLRPSRRLQPSSPPPDTRRTRRNERSSIRSKRSIHAKD